MKTLAIAASLILALTATPSLAETSIHAGGFSYHVATGYKNDYNSNHKLLAVEHNGVLVGRFSNSYDRTTAIAAHGQDQAIVYATRLRQLSTPAAGVNRRIR